MEKGKLHLWKGEAKRKKVLKTTTNWMFRNTFSFGRAAAIVVQVYFYSFDITFDCQKGLFCMHALLQMQCSFFCALLQIRNWQIDCCQCSWLLPFKKVSNNRTYRVAKQETSFYKFESQKVKWPLTASEVMEVNII